MEMTKRITQSLKQAVTVLVNTIKDSSHTPSYRVVNIELDALDEYYAMIQIVNTSKCFKAKPEEILADDKMTDQFSPRDVRMLTYLGYLGINSPKYKILAKQLSEDNNQLICLLHKKGSKKVVAKTASEISASEETLRNLDQHDAHMVGYLTGTEQIQTEKIEKEKIMKKIENKS